MPIILGIISSFTLPPYNYVFLNFLTFPFLLFIIFELKKYKKKPIVFFKVGWLFGFGYFLSNLYWITYSLYYDDMYIYLIPFALIVIPGFLAIFYGLITLALFKINVNKTITSLIIFSLIFSIVEFIRGNILSGFPWNLISYSWSSSINLLQIISITGTYTFNLISITIFTLPFIFIFQKDKTKKLIVIFILSLLLVSNYIYGNITINNNDKQNLKSLNYKIKIISPKISIDKYFSNMDQKEILADLIKLSDPKKKIQHYIFGQKEF